MSGQRGFTLFEALVAGVVSLVIPAVLIAVFSNTNQELSGGASAIRIVQIATAVSEEIERAGSSAVWVFDAAAAQGLNCPPNGNPPASDWNGIDSGVIFCDASRKIINGFRIQNTKSDSSILEEFIPGKVPPWQPMVFAGDTVYVLTNPDPYNTCPPQCREQGLFGIGDLDTLTGAWAWFNFRYDMQVAGKRVTLPMQMQSVVCRNSVSRM